MLCRTDLPQGPGSPQHYSDIFSSRGGSGRRVEEDEGNLNPLLSVARDLDGPTRTDYRKAHPMLLLQKEEQTRKTEEEDVPYLSDSREGSSDYLPRLSTSEAEEESSR